MRFNQKVLIAAFLFLVGVPFAGARADCAGYTLADTNNNSGAFSDGTFLCTCQSAQNANLCFGMKATTDAQCKSFAEQKDSNNKQMYSLCSFKGDSGATAQANGGTVTRSSLNPTGTGIVDTIKANTSGTNGNATSVSQTGSTGAIVSTVVPGTSVDASSGLVQCGRPGQNMCTLCDFFKGMNYIIQYIMKISVAVGLAAFTIAGVIYIVSAGDSGTITTAKNVMKNAGIGFVVIFAGWLIINYTITIIGTRPGMGINVTSWGQFSCSSTAAQHVQ